MSEMWGPDDRVEFVDVMEKSSLSLAQFKVLFGANQFSPGRRFKLDYDGVIWEIIGEPNLETFRGAAILIRPQGVHHPGRDRMVSMKSAYYDFMALHPGIKPAVIKRRLEL